MMVENHYDDEVLIAMLSGDPDSIAQDPHLAACDACRGILENVRLMAGALSDECVWDRRDLSEEPVPETVDLLRATAARMDMEDAEAEHCLAELLAGPRETWMPRLEEHPEWRTAGVVRRLVWRADNEVHAIPLDALEMAKMAVEIADTLRDRNLLAAACRACAYDLFFTGHFAEALIWIDRADASLSKVRGTVTEFDAARQTMVRALILDAQERSAEAVDATAESSRTFAEFGDRKRWLYGTYISAMTEYARRNIKAAISLFESLEMPLRDLDDLPTLAGIYESLAFCYSEERRFSEASSRFVQATALLDELGMTAEAVRTRWSMGVMQLHCGNYNLAIKELRASESQLRDLGMLEDSFRASLDVIEAQLAIGQVDGAAATASRVLRDAQTPSLAATATGYLRELVNAPEMAQPRIQEVRHDIRLLREHPRLLFAYSTE
jgi:tetratricopeptide (TPR) repeat protein